VGCLFPPGGRAEARPGGAYRRKHPGDAFSDMHRFSFLRDKRWFA